MCDHVLHMETLDKDLKALAVQYPNSRLGQVAQHVHSQKNAMSSDSCNLRVGDLSAESRSQLAVALAVLDGGCGSRAAAFQNPPTARPQAARGVQSALVSV